MKMKMNKKIIIVIVIFILLIASVLISFHFHSYLKKKKQQQILFEKQCRLEFLNKSIKNRQDCKILLKYAEKYELDWLKVFAVLMVESGGNANIISRTKDYGYMQLSRYTAKILRKRLKKIIKNTHILNPEFNIAGGCLYLRTLLDFYGNGTDWKKAVEIYNVGFGRYREGKKNNNHVKKFIIYYTYYKFEYKEFKKKCLKLKNKG